MIEKIKVLSPAKINLDLLILNKREDSYHNISSLIQPIDFYDEISIELSSGLNLVELSFPGNIVSFDDNLIVKAALKFLTYFQINRPIRISVKKRIPLGSGLGGGSSNAASTLIGLSKLFQIDDFAALSNIALELGSDVPFFLYSRTSRVSGRGELVEPFEIKKKINYLLILPGVHSDTRSLYDLWDNQEERSKRIDNCNTNWHINKESLINGKKFVLQNDFTPLLISSDNIYLEIFDVLKGLGLDSYSITGSGSTIFCVIDDNQDCREIIKYIESSGDFSTIKAESFEGWHFTFD